MIGATSPLLLREPGQFIASHDGRLVTVAGFLAQVQGVARTLPASGAVMNLCEDRYHFLVGFAAALARGLATLLPPNPLPETLNAIHRDWPGSHALIDGPVTGLDAPLVTLDLARAGRADNFGVAEDTLAAVAFTSGTTGASVPQPKTWRTLVAGAAINLPYYLGPGPGPHAVVATVPPQHMWGFESTILAALRGPVIAHAGRPFYPADVRAALLGLPAPRMLVSTPVHLRALAGSGLDFPPVARVLSATAPMDVDLAGRVERLFAAELVEIYGCTEVGSMAWRRTALDQPWRVLEGLQATSAAGVTTISAAHLPAAVRLPDVLEFEPDGAFRLAGRDDDLVKIGGKRGSLAEIARLLLATPGIDDAAVFRTPGDPDDARPVAMVVTRTLDADSIRAALRRVLDPVFVPRPILLVTALPRSSTGKLTRAALLELHARCIGHAAAGD
jgi:acyl-coenzyme A synthetase/AMP-(fatty) acid ligase